MIPRITASLSFVRDFRQPDTGCLYSCRQLANFVSFSILQATYLQSLTDGTVIAITVVCEEPDRAQNSRARMDAEDHEDSEWKRGR
jgi:hypothetical protein